MLCATCPSVNTVSYTNTVLHTTIRTILNFWSALARALKSLGIPQPFEALALSGSR
jgi:hypothetical protein